MIGSILRNPVYFDSIQEFLTANDFMHPKHRQIFKAMSEMSANQEPIDAITVCEKISESGIEPDLDYIVGLHLNTVTTANAQWYARMVKNKSIERGLLHAADEIITIVNGDGPTEEKRNLVQTLFSKIDEQEKSCAKPAGEIIQHFIATLEDRESGNQLGLLTGFDMIDRRLRGLRGGNLVIIAGRPGMGKTTLAMNIAEHIALDDKGVLVFSLEMSEQELIEKSLASVGRIPYHLIRDGKVCESDYAQPLVIAAGRLKQSGLLIDDTGALHTNTMLSRARRIHRQTPLSMIVVDYLQLAKTSKAENRTQEITKISGALKAMAKELNIPVVVLSQLNRELEKRANKRPILSDLRESGSIEQDADIIIFLYRDDYYNEKSTTPNTCEIDIAKFRGGKPGKEYLTSALHLCRFDNRFYDADYSMQQEQKSVGFEY